MKYNKETWLIDQKVTIIIKNKPVMVSNIIKINKTSVTIGIKESKQLFKFDGYLKTSYKWNTTRIVPYRIDHLNTINRLKILNIIQNFNFSELDFENLYKIYKILEPILKED